MAATPEHLDRNYGGILIIRDRMLGSLQPETPVPHVRPDKAGWHLQHLEAADPRVRRRSPRLAPPIVLAGRLGYVFGPPGWAPPARCQADRVVDRVVAFPRPEPSDGRAGPRIRTLSGGHHLVLTFGRCPRNDVGRRLRST
jgi:hypothetical protein